MNIMSARHLNNRAASIPFYNGFTLAEVLITLGIIGIVAAMTIPTLINQTKHAEYVTALKKASSVLSQAHEQIVADNGDFASALSNATTSTDFANVFVPKLKVAKNCATQAGTTDCD